MAQSCNPVTLDWGALPTKRCERDRWLWPLVNFRHDAESLGCVCTSETYECAERHHYRDVCLCCENTAKHRRPLEVRAYQKVCRTLRRHVRQDGYQSLTTWQQTMGISAHMLSTRLVDIVNANCCPSCEQPFAGLADMSLDRIDPTKALSRTNLEWICRTCNIEKARTPPHIWAIRRRCWIIYRNDVLPHLPEQQALPLG